MWEELKYVDESFERYNILLMLGLEAGSKVKSGKNTNEH